MKKIIPLFCLNILCLILLTSCAGFQANKVYTNIEESTSKKDITEEMFKLLSYENYKDLDKEYFLNVIDVVNELDLDFFTAPDADKRAYDYILTHQSQNKFLLEFINTEDFEKPLVLCKIINREFSCKKTKNYNKNNPFYLDYFDLKN